MKQEQNKRREKKKNSKKITKKLTTSIDNCQLQIWGLDMYLISNKGSMFLLLKMYLTLSWIQIQYFEKEILMALYFNFYYIF